MNVAEIWAHANDTLSAISWPAFAAVVVFGFRKQIGDRIRNMRRYKGTLGEVDFNESVEAVELTANLQDGVGNVIEAYAGVQATATITAEAEVTAGDDEASAAESSMQTSMHYNKAATLLDLRQDIENIIRASWSSGFEAGSSGYYSAEPVPEIQWTGALPEVTGWSAGLDIMTDAGRRASGMPPRRNTEAEIQAHRRTAERAVEPELRIRSEKVARLEDEIRRLRLQQGRFGTKSWESTHSMLSLLQRELRGLDPKSPYANIDL